MRCSFVGMSACKQTQHQHHNRTHEALQPALSHLQQLLEDDDLQRSPDYETPPLSPTSLLAFHATASEIASILKQDSPTLSFNLTLDAPPPTSQTFKLSRVIFQPAPCLPPYEVPSPLFHFINSSPSFTSKWNRTFFSIASDSPVYGGHHSPADEDHRRRLLALMPGEAEGQCGEHSPCLYEDVQNLLIKCAHAIGCNDKKSALQLLGKVKLYASAHGNGAERVAYYFAEALDARLCGTGWQIYTGRLGRVHPSSKQIMRAIFMYMSSCPFAKAIHYFVNEAVLDVAKGAKTLHIMEHLVTGFQYPSLFKALAARPGGPPQVHLLAINIPHFTCISDCDFVLETLEHRGRQLLACASSYGVPFQFTAWAGRIDTLGFKGFVNPNRHEDEKLVISSGYPLRFVYDDVLNPPTKRFDQLKRMKSHNPDLYVQGSAVGSYNTPIFPRRAKEALFHFERLYDMLDTFIDRGNVERSVLESEILGKSVLNIVACEDANVVERITMYKSMHALTKQAGFKQLVLSPEMKQEVRDILKSWHKDYTVVDDLEYILMGWKGRILHALSLWTGSDR